MQLHQTILGILFALALTQSVCCQPVDYTSAEIQWAINVMNIDPTGSEKLLVFVVNNMITIPKQHAAKAVDVSRSMLKDETLSDNTEPEVLEFKKKLNAVLAVYEPSATEMKSYYTTMDRFANVCEYYYQLPEDNVTTANKFIADLLDKYHCKQVAMGFTGYLETFLTEFNKMFDENKKDLDKPILEWHAKYVTLTDMQEKMKAIIEFIDLA